MLHETRRYRDFGRSRLDFEKVSKILDIKFHLKETHTYAFKISLCFIKYVMANIIIISELPEY